ncbi:MAG: hypothetical protein KDA96_15060 [Planctomycetaceae bacterium]|nr:hypothetical protein [Planctomycetaceae bacterium]
MRIDWDSFTNHTETIAEVRLLGIVDFPSMLALQKLVMHDVRIQGRINAAVMICEHPPSVSIPVGASLLQLPTDPRELESRLLQVHKVRRDGPAILHQPGQLAVYVIVSLPECGLSVDDIRRKLAAAVIHACEDQQVVARVDPQDPSCVRGRHGIIAEIALQVADGITGFGIVLNVSCSLEDAAIVGRGLNGARISSLNAERVRPTLMPQLRSALIEKLTEELGYPEYHIHTGHPFLKRLRNIQKSSSVPHE